MLKNNKQKDAAITLIITKVAKQIKSVLEIKGLLRSLLKAAQDIIAAIIAALT